MLPIYIVIIPEAYFSKCKQAYKNKGSVYTLNHIFSMECRMHTNNQGNWNISKKSLCNWENEKWYKLAELNKII